MEFFLLWRQLANIIKKKEGADRVNKDFDESKGGAGEKSFKDEKKN